MRRALVVLALLCPPLAAAAPADALICAEAGLAPQANVEVCVAENLCLASYQTTGTTVPNTYRCFPLPTA